MDERDFTSKMTPRDAQRLRTNSVGRRPASLNRFSVRNGGEDDEPISEDSLEARDQTELFQQVIAIIRWGVLGLLVILSTPDICLLYTSPSPRDRG